MSAEFHALNGAVGADASSSSFIIVASIYFAGIVFFNEILSILSRLLHILLLLYLSF